jgi:hypothetical protein
LDETIRISEVGFGREDAQVHDTSEVFTEWNQLLVAMAKLEAQLTVAC